MFGNRLSSQSHCLQQRNDGRKKEGKILSPALPAPHITCWKPASVYFPLESSCPRKINRYLFRTLSKASGNLTFGERESTCCWTPPSLKRDVATAATLLEANKEMFDAPAIYDVLPISITIQPNQRHSLVSHAQGTMQYPTWGGKTLSLLRTVIVHLCALN